MRLTRLGWGCLLMAALALMSAAATGNNLLYLLYGGLVAALLLSAIAGPLNLRRARASAELPQLVFRAAPFSLKLLIRNEGRWPAFGIAVSGRSARAAASLVAAGGQASCQLPYSLPYRGLNRLDDISLESLFPFGLMVHRRAVEGLVGNALPRLREVHAAAEITADARASGRPVPRKGRGEELYGIREYGAGDDSRSINWKLTAKAGRPVVNEFSAAQESRITVRLDGASEERIEEAASACRYYIDAGAEVRLVTPEEELDYGKGLLHLDKLLEALARLGEGRNPRSAGLGGAAPAAAAADSPALRRLTWLGAALVYAAMFLIDEINPWLLAAFSPALPLGWVLEGRGGPRLPKALWNAASLAVLFFILLVDWRHSGVIVANTHLLLYLIVNRLLDEVRTEELSSYFLILFLGFFLVSGLTISLWYFLFFLLYAAFACAWLMLAWGASFAPRRSWALAGAALLASGLGLAAVCFAATPRVEGFRRFNPFLVAGIDKLQIKASAVMGFTENVSLGFFGELKRSSARVMRIKPTLLAEERRPPPLRVRGAAFDTFDGRRWTKSPVDFHYALRGRRYASAVGRGWALQRGEAFLFPASPKGEALPPYEFTIYPMNLSVIFTVGTPWLVEGAGAAISFDHTDSLVRAAPYMGGLSYRVFAKPGPLGFGASLQNYEKSILGRFLQLSSGGDGRVAALARRITAQAADDEAKARAVEAHLRRGYSYSLFMDGRDRSLEHFLFDSRRGNCEYFATAGALLLRHAGVPARLVSGFLVEDWNEYGKFYDARQSAAHAWVEVYLRGRGWMTIDPTPPQGAFAASADLMSRRLERYFDALQARWYRHVIGYDQYVQGSTFKRLGAAFSTDLLLGLAKAAMALAGLAGLWLLARQFLAGLRKRSAASRAGFFERAQAALEEAGLARPPHLTPREYARWVVSRRPDLEPFAGLAELHYLQSYSPRGLSRAEADRASRLLTDIRSKA